MNHAFCRIAKRFAVSASALTKRSRFYKNASVARVSATPSPLYNVLLDQRKLKTPTGKVLEIQSEPLALAIAQEWNSQQKELNMGHMRLTGLLFTALDNPYALTKQDIVSKVLEYLETDTVLFRSSENEKLVHLQDEKWDPIVKWANQEFKLSLRPSYSIVEMPSVDAESTNNLERHLLSYGFLSLTGIQYAVESVKSLLISLSVMGHHLDAEDAVDRALLEQRFQANIWGNVEWAHDIEREELLSRLTAGVLFAHLTSNIYSNQPIAQHSSNNI